MELTTILLLLILGVVAAGLIVLLRNRSLSVSEELSETEMQFREGIRALGTLIQDESRRTRQDNDRGFRDSRSEMQQNFAGVAGSVNQTLESISAHQHHELRALREQIGMIEQTLSEDLQFFENRFTQNVQNLNELQREKLEAQTVQLDAMEQKLNDRLEAMQKDNREKLEQMRATVDEKLEQTVKRRFNESFQIISDRLEQVHRGLGEMQNLAVGVGDLKRVLSNVKTRGTLGEIQLGSILEQMLAPQQFEKNAHPDPQERAVVEYAVRLPGTEDGQTVLLPIDSKFPLEPFERLQAAMEHGTDPKELALLRRAFEASVKKNARDIQSKYIRPPATTDFALMFVPTEGLYAEILRSAGLFDDLQRENRVTVVGPANLAAFLSSLQMGFRTLAIQKRSGEVWELLGSVRTDFQKFGDILEKTKAQLERTIGTIEDAGKRTRAIERQLANVQAIPQGEENE